MKHFFAFAAVLFSLSINAQWDDVRVNPILGDVNLKGVDFLNENTGFVCGYSPVTDTGAYGRLFITSNRGATWNNMWLEENIGFWDVVVTDSNRVWVMGDSGLVLQLDQLYVIHEYQRISPYSLHCGFSPTNNLLYTAGEHGVLYRTTDAGLTWDTLTTNTTETINDIYFSDAANGWIAGDGGYLATTSDSGLTWNFVSQPQWGFTDFRSIAYQDTIGLNPYIVGENGSGQFSIDGGTSWFAFATGTTNTIHQIRFMNTMSGFMVGENGYINHSVDAGASWFGHPSSETVDFYDIAFSGDTTAFICGDSNVVLRSRNDVSNVMQHSSVSLAAKLYPNPSAGPLFAEVLMRQAGDVTISMYDVTGQIISSTHYDNVSEGANRFALNTETIAPGIYYVQITAGDARITLPYIRQ